ncbi:hypothetical protein [Aerosakkonema funiforme]|uniref:hypothetical protein n=1 Tax=Aerosakkonema funiforme TaxID=1246630 RepID=UPI0035B9AB72
MESGHYGHDGKITQVVEHSSNSHFITPEMQHQIYTGCIALAVIAGMTMLLREVRLLVEACKK